MTLIALLALIIRLIIRLFQKRSVLPALKTIAIIILSYTLLWVIFYFLSSFKAVPAGTDICFDDWCATITAFEKPDALGNGNHVTRACARYALEELTGKQILLDSRLELHQSLETRLVFDVPADSKDLKAIIEEGPLITRLLFNENKKVFSLK